MKNNISELELGTVKFVNQEIISFNVSNSDKNALLSNGEVLSFHGVGQYIKIKISTTVYIVVQISMAQQTEFKSNSSENYKIIDTNMYTGYAVARIENGETKAGVITLPKLDDPVFLMNNQDVKSLFSPEDQNYYNIGTLTNYSVVTPKFSLEKLLTGHTAILGNTGSGKSTTMRVILDQISRYQKNFTNNPKFIIFDIHDDYSSENSNDVISLDDFFIDPNDLTIDDWVTLFNPSENSQKPIMQRALKIAKLSEDELQKISAIILRQAIDTSNFDSLAAANHSARRFFKKIEDTLQQEFTQEFPNGIKIIIDKKDKYQNKNTYTANSAQVLLDLIFTQDFGNTSNSPRDKFVRLLNKAFDICEIKIDDILDNSNGNILSISNITDALEFVFEELETQGNRQSRFFSEGLVVRIQNIQSALGNTLFKISNDKTNIINSLNHEEGFQLRIIKFPAGIDDDSLKLITNFVTRKIFINWSNITKVENRTPIYLYFDEAHRYIKSTAGNGENSVFEKISREGRKFGIYLGIISQIPSELSSVVLSQTSSFFIHRLQNEIDLLFVKKSVPSVTKDMISRLPQLGPGTLITSGNHFMIPSEIVVSGENNYGKGESISPFNK
ncbi:ATP-binding protein [Leuconostoc mesenteroides]